MAERFPLENLKVVGNSVYRVAPDGQMFFVRSLSQDPTANTDVFAATPPRADDPSFYAATPEPDSYFGQQAAGMASPYLKNAYNLASTATTMTPDPNNYAPEVVQRLGHAATNYGIAALQTFLTPFYGAAGLVGDVAKAAGVPRSEALVRDLGAMLDVAGVLPEGRILSAMADAGAVGQVAGNAKRAVNAAVEKAPVVYADAIGNARALAQGDLEFMRGRGLPSESAAAGAQVTGQGTGAGAIIRPDDVFRGNGPIKTSLDVATKPYAVRLTGQSQIDDMIQSGLIRPKEGGYGQEGKATLFFGEMDDAVPNSVFTRPKGDGDKNYTIVADSSKVAGREGPIPLDDVQHIWTIRDGQMVDILDEVKAKNRDYGAAPGIGDNGGPPLMDPTLDIFEAPPQRQRYVDPATGRYSKAFEAAHDLKQNIMTPEQARVGLINQGVKEEELLYTGFDSWLQGKDKVTKDEVINILGDIAINKSGQGSLPFNQTVHTAFGTVGDIGFDLDLIRGQVRQDRERGVVDLADDYRHDLRARLDESGFSRIPTIRTVEDFVALENQITRSLDLGQPVPPVLQDNVEYVRRMLGTGVRGMLNRNSGFDNMDVTALIGRINGINGNLPTRLRGADMPQGMYVAPDGAIIFENTAFERQFPDQETPRDLSTRMTTEAGYEIDRMDEQQLADYIGQDASILNGGFNANDTSYAENAPKGVFNYDEVLYNYDDKGRGVLSLSQQDYETKSFPSGHTFSSGRGTGERVYHVRRGDLDTPEGPARYVFELQSDIAQRYRNDPSKFQVTGTKPVFEVPKAERKKLQEYVTVGKKYEDLMSQQRVAEEVLYSDKYLDMNTGRFKKDEEGYEELSSHVRDIREKLRPLSTKLTELATSNQVLDDMQRFYGRPDMSMLYGDALDIKAIEEALAGTLKPKPGSPGSTQGKTSTLPFTTSTNRWVPDALKGELIRAAKDDVEWFMLPTGKDVKSWTHGEVEGQEDFYENIVPTQLRNLLKKEYGVTVPLDKVTGEGRMPKGTNPKYEGNAIRLTPELKKMILGQGFSTFKKGGPVEGSTLSDVDVFALA